ncbi:MAG: energy transducer TonB [Parvularculaceae bacterium]
MADPLFQFLPFRLSGATRLAFLVGAGVVLASALAIAEIKGARPASRLEERGDVQIAVDEGPKGASFRVHNAGARRQRVTIAIGALTADGARNAATLTYVLRPFEIGPRRRLADIGREGGWIVSWTAEPVDDREPLASAWLERPLTPFHRAPPSYPVACAEKSRRVERVVLRYDVDARGRPGAAAIVDGPPCLGAAARRASRGWRYAPALRDGAPHAVRAVETVVTFERKS